LVPSFVGVIAVVKNFTDERVFEENVPKLGAEIWPVCYVCGFGDILEEFSITVHCLGHGEEFEKQELAWLPFNTVTPKVFGDPRFVPFVGRPGCAVFSDERVHGFA
jgi:hypothetical protein